MSARELSHCRCTGTIVLGSSSGGCMFRKASLTCSLHASYWTRSQQQNVGSLQVHHASCDKFTMPLATSSPCLLRQVHHASHNSHFLFIACMNTYTIHACVKLQAELYLLVLCFSALRGHIEAPPAVDWRRRRRARLGGSRRVAQCATAAATRTRSKTVSGSATHVPMDFYGKRVLHAKL